MPLQNFLLLLLAPLLLAAGSGGAGHEVFLVHWHKSGTIAARTFLQAWELALARRFGSTGLFNLPLHVHHHRFINDVARAGPGGKVGRAYCEECGPGILLGGCLGSGASLPCRQCEFESRGLVPIFNGLVFLHRDILSRCHSQHNSGCLTQFHYSPRGGFGRDSTTKDSGIQVARGMPKPRRRRIAKSDSMVALLATWPLRPAALAGGGTGPPVGHFLLFVRNPFEQAVSYFLYHSRRPEQMFRSFSTVGGVIVDVVFPRLSTHLY